MANKNIFDTNDIRTTGLTVDGITILSGNSSSPILIVTGETGTFMEVVDDPTSGLLWGISGDTGAVFNVNNNSVDVYVDMNYTGNTNTLGNITINGSLSATTKSFDIKHPTREGYRITYGCLEGPEHAVYHRGHTKSDIIELPEYWSELVNVETTTVQLTPIGNNYNPHWVERVENNQIYIKSETGKIGCYFLVHGERQDVPKILVVYKSL
jgi:hypothetical protein